MSPVPTSVSLLIGFIVGLAVQAHNTRNNWQHGWDTGYESGWSEGSGYVVGLMSRDLAVKSAAKVEKQAKSISGLTGKPINICAFAKLECQYHGK